MFCSLFNGSAKTWPEDKCWLVKRLRAWGIEHGDKARKAGKARKGRSEGKGPLGTRNLALGTVGRRGGAERIDERSEVGEQRTELAKWPKGGEDCGLRIANCGFEKIRSASLRCDLA